MNKTITDVVIEQGYEKWENPSTYVLYKNTNDYLNIVNFIGIKHDTDLPAKTIEGIRQYVKNGVPNNNDLPIKYLVIIVDEGAKKEMIRHYSELITNLWILNTKENKLLVFENQTTEFDGLYPVIEHYLQDIEKEKKQGLLPRVGIVTLILILANVITYIILNIGGDVYDPQYMFDHGASFWAAVIYDKEYYRLFTSMFMHFGIEHLLNNMVSLCLWGTLLEQMIGKVRYLILYLAAGLAGGIASVYFNMWEYTHVTGTMVVSAGASGAIYGIMGGVLLGGLIDKNKRKFFPKQRIGLLVIISIVYMFTETGVDQTAHIGGFLGGFLICMIYFIANRLRGKKL